MTVKTIPDFVTNYARSNGMGAHLVDFITNHDVADGLADWSETLFTLLQNHPKKANIIFSDENSQVEGIKLSYDRSSWTSCTRHQLRKNLATNIKNHPDIVEALLPYPSLHKWLYIPIEKDIGRGHFPAKELAKAAKTHPITFKMAYQNHFLGNVTGEGKSVNVYSEVHTHESTFFDALACLNGEASTKDLPNLKSLIRQALTTPEQLIKIAREVEGEPTLMLMEARCLPEVAAEIKAGKASLSILTAPETEFQPYLAGLIHPPHKAQEAKEKPAIAKPLHSVFNLIRGRKNHPVQMITDNGESLFNNPKYAVKPTDPVKS